MIDRNNACVRVSVQSRTIKSIMELYSISTDAHIYYRYEYAYIFVLI